MIVKSEVIVRETHGGPWHVSQEVHLQFGSTYRLLGVFQTPKMAGIFVEAYNAAFSRELAALSDINNPRLLDAALDYLQKG